MTPTRIVLLTLTLGLMVPTLASADIVRPREEPCAPGSELRTRHGGQYCEPMTCSAEAPCQAPLVCTEGIGLCQKETTRRGGRRGSGPEYVEISAEGSCTTDADCAVGICVVAARCVDPNAKPPEVEAEPPAPRDPPPQAEAPDPVEEEGRCSLAPGLVGPLSLLVVLIGLLGRRR